MFLFHVKCRGSTVPYICLTEPLPWNEFIWFHLRVYITKAPSWSEGTINILQPYVLMIEIDLLKIDLLQIWQSLSDQRPKKKQIHPYWIHPLISGITGPFWSSGKIGSTLINDLPHMGPPQDIPSLFLPSGVSKQHFFIKHKQNNRWHLPHIICFVWDKYIYIIYYIYLYK